MERNERTEIVVTCCHSCDLVMLAATESALLDGSGIGEICERDFWVNNNSNYWGMLIVEVVLGHN